MIPMQDNLVDAKEWRRVGLPWSEGLIKRTFTAPNGTLLAARVALHKGLSCHLAGGTHHRNFLACRLAGGEIRGSCKSGLCYRLFTPHAEKGCVLGGEVHN